MGFGIDNAIYDQTLGHLNARVGLEKLAENVAVRERTIIAPHAFGPQVSGEPRLSVPSWWKQ